MSEKEIFLSIIMVALTLLGLLLLALIGCVAFIKYKLWSIKREAMREHNLSSKEFDDLLEKYQTRQG